MLTDCAHLGFAPCPYSRFGNRDSGFGALLEQLVYEPFFELEVPTRPHSDPVGSHLLVAHDLSSTLGSAVQVLKGVPTFVSHLTSRPAGRSSLLAARPSGHKDRQLGGSAGRQPEGQRARRPDDQRARRPGGQAARRPGGQAARRPGGQAASRSPARALHHCQGAAAALCRLLRLNRRDAVGLLLGPVLAARPGVLRVAGAGAPCFSGKWLSGRSLQILSPGSFVRDL